MPIAHGAQLHYRSVFSLVDEAESGDGWGDIIKTIRLWVSQRTPTDLGLGGRWFYIGGVWTPSGAPRVLVKTARAVGNGTEVQPQSWALRFEHPDRDVFFRQWRTDIGITMVDPNTYQFSLATTQWILPEYIGQEPDLPVPSAPSIVSKLLRARRWKAFAGSEPLVSDPVWQHEGEGKEFQDRLENPNRGCPIVYLSRDFATDLIKVDPTALSRLLAGTATVFAAATRGVDKELEQLLPRNYRCWNGMIRVYQPQVRVESNLDYKRHRFFRSEEIEEHTPEGVQDIIVRAVARRSRLLAAEGVTSIEDIEDKQREIRLEELKTAAAEHGVTQEFL